MHTGTTAVPWHYWYTSCAALPRNEKLENADLHPGLAAVYCFPSSTKTLGLRSKETRTGTPFGTMTAQGTSDRRARIRWLTYWALFGVWWRLSWCFDGLLGKIPLSAHAQLSLVLWLQTPLFRAGERVLDAVERCNRSISARVWWISGSGAPPSSECILKCGTTVTHSRSGSKCPSGHVLCAGCTSQYVVKMLLPQRIVRWDRINCVHLECTEHMEGVSVQRCLSRGLVERIDAEQLELVPMLGSEDRRERERAAEAARLEGVRASVDDRASEAYVAESTKPCPVCRAPSVLITGCKHTNCRCGHEYCWECRCDWVIGHVSVNCAPR